MHNNIEKLKKKHGFDEISIEYLEHVPDLRTFTRNLLVKPLRMFFTEPIVFVVTIMGATVYALAYLLTELVPGLYSGFNLTLRQVGLVFLVIGVGGFPSLQNYTTVGSATSANGRTEF